MIMQNSLKLKNSFILAPIKVGYSDGTGMITPSHIHFYEQRSQYLGAMIIEPLYLHRNLREIPTQIGIDHEDKIPRLQELTTLLHSHGTKVIAHLNHPGRMANPKIPKNRFISSTDKPCPNGGAIPKSMDQASMKEVQSLFVDAAVRAEKAGFDMLEVQFGHGYLLAQFLSPDVNDRLDEYGESFENRIRFPLEVLASIKNSISIPIIARISGDEMIPTGFHMDEMIRFAEILQTQGVAAIHVSAGTVCSTPPWFFQHMFIPKGKTWKFAQQIQENIEIPVIYVGRVNSPKDVEELESQYNAQYIAIGRGLVADPLLVGKILGKEREPIVPCLACMEGCLGGVKSGQGLQCLVNPSVQKTPVTLPTYLIKVSQPKAFAIVGGGLAGMEAAITLAQRGHKVEIFEKDRLGGQFQY
ncbi:MAG: oxidoreductase, partial [Promethearchaeota archaeon]